MVAAAAAAAIFALYDLTIFMDSSSKRALKTKLNTPFDK
jgi:hypothetical protein